MYAWKKYSVKSFRPKRGEKESFPQRIDQKEDHETTSMHNNNEGR
jgi:hypothetical protein